MSMKWARQKVAAAWCQPKTENKEMDVDLAEEFAKILDRETSVPLLGNATTGELLNELIARAEVAGYINYKTVDDV